MSDHLCLKPCSLSQEPSWSASLLGQERKDCWCLQEAISCFTTIPHSFTTTVLVHFQNLKQCSCLDDYLGWCFCLRRGSRRSSINSSPSCLFLLHTVWWLIHYCASSMVCEFFLLLQALTQYVMCRELHIRVSAILYSKELWAKGASSAASSLRPDRVRWRTMACGGVFCFREQYCLF